MLLLSACAVQPHYAGDGWDGRRGYDGSGDYGYDVNASRAEARSYRVRAARDYPAPGPASDPWGPYIVESAARFSLPDRWVREVMHQESGGRQMAADGTLTTSYVGAMGLMQVMPTTYDMLRQRYGLGDDPYDPHDNIMAGAAYIREMYDRFGAPAFLAAYNAGPDRVDAYLAGTGGLPDETANYLARVAPRLGTAVGMTGPLAVYAGGGSVPASDADRAFDGGGLVTASAPTGEFTGTAPVTLAAPAAPGAPGVWGIQVGAFPDPSTSRAAVAAAWSQAADLLAGAQPAIVPVQHGGTLYRARLMGVSADVATAACLRLSQGGLPCLTVPPY